MEAVRPKAPISTSSTPHHVVIGIDFGTTYSGVSWTWSKAARPDQITTVHKWEVGAGNGKNQGADKVPSKISYDERGRVLRWGYMVTPQDEYQAEWFKLLLSSKARSQGGERVEQTDQLLKLLHKSPVDVVADYLRCLWGHAVETIELALSQIAVDNMTFKVVLTLPANWDDMAISLTKKAAQLAGIEAVRSRGPTTLKTVSEPEAAALAAWNESGMQWRPDVTVGDSFVVCDAGGGTVDLISYTVDSLDPLKLSMCVEASGALCGAVYLDDAFDAQMRIEVGAPIYDKITPEIKARVFEMQWEYGPKRTYIGPNKGPQEFSVDIPGYKPKRAGLFKSSKRQGSSTIILKSGHLNQMFQPVVGRIVDLVRTQVDEVKYKTSKEPKVVLLVGGFGENDFILDQLRATFPRITIQRPTNAWGAISRGAVIKGLSTSAETETVTNFISKLNYGVKHATKFNPSLHSFRDKYTCPIQGVEMAKNQFTWYLRRGESVSKIIPVEYNWLVPLTRSSQVEKVNGEIWVSDLKDLSSKMAEKKSARRLCEITCNFEPSIFYQLRRQFTPDMSTEYRELDYTLDMKIAAGELEWIIYWRDQQKGLAKVKVEYES